VHANYYEAFSATRYYMESSGTQVSEKALDGWDVEGQLQVPFMPWAHASITGYGWEGANQNDIEGYRIACLMNVTSNIVFEFGRSDDDAAENNFARVSFTLGRPERVEYTLLENFIMRRFFTDRDLQKQTLAKVRRHSTVVVEKTRSTSGGSSAVTGGIFITRGN
jgi:hypothetical protein